MITRTILRCIACPRATSALIRCTRCGAGYCQACAQRARSGRLGLLVCETCWEGGKGEAA